jgi:peroxiredoxin Q/BCP
VVQSAAYIGKKPLVIFFYPRDDTFGCTVESCTFRDAYGDFAAAGADVIGISADPISSHRRFRAKYALPFILASDVDRRAARAYGVPEGPLGLAGRATFVIDQHGIVRDAFASRLRVKRHVSRALGVVRRLAAASDTPPEGRRS